HPGRRRYNRWDGKILPLCVGGRSRVGGEHLGEVPVLLVTNVNIDGLPITTSTSDQFWPVLCQVMNCGESEPCSIEVYYGKTKARYANTFLEPTVSDMNTVLNEGISVEGYRVSIKLAAIVCDAPAEAYVL
ncbi:hypothetical protein IscW_ISCW024764, partial [Ixodes scapularis]